MNIVKMTLETVFRELEPCGERISPRSSRYVVAARSGRVRQRGPAWASEGQRAAGERRRRSGAE